MGIANSTTIQIGLNRPVMTFNALTGFIRITPAAVVIVAISSTFHIVSSASFDINDIATPTTVYAETYTSADYTVPNAPYLDGYDFKGWTVNDTLYTTADEVQTAVESLVKSGTAVTVKVD